MGGVYADDRVAVLRFAQEEARKVVVGRFTTDLDPEGSGDPLDVDFGATYLLPIEEILGEPAHERATDTHQRSTLARRATVERIHCCSICGRSFRTKSSGASDVLEMPA